TMLASCGFLVLRLYDHNISSFERLSLAGATLAAAIGILLCAARQPLIVGAAILAISWPLDRFSLRSGLASLFVCGASAYVAVSNDRFQRIWGLDTEMVQVRVNGSINDNLGAIFVDYPLGAGMGSSQGTSIPY